jgi:phosphatidylglycerophosphate synthase
LRDAALSDAEEFSDLYVHRPIAARLVRALVAAPITPNQVTLLSGATGLLAAVALARSADRPTLRLVSAALLFASTILDCCDGQLARAKNMMSANGVALDAAADVVVGSAMVLAATALVVQTGGAPRLWLLAPVALASYGLQCFFVDVMKERFLAAHGLRYASSKAVQADQRRARGGGVRAWLFALYWRAAGPLIRSSDAASAGRISPAAMGLWTTVGQGTHMTCLYVAAAISYIWPPALLACLLVFAVVMNVVMAGLIVGGASPIRASRRGTTDHRGHGLES